MRNSYTAPMVVELLARNLNFGCVYGISAGSSHTVNYLVRDATRARASFVELVKYPRFGGWGSFLRGTGYFNSPYLYEELIENAPAGDPMAFDPFAITSLRGAGWDTSPATNLPGRARVHHAFSCRPPPSTGTPTWTAIAGAHAAPDESVSPSCAARSPRRCSSLGLPQASHRGRAHHRTPHDSGSNWKKCARLSTGRAPTTPSFAPTKPASPNHHRVEAVKAAKAEMDVAFRKG